MAGVEAAENGVKLTVAVSCYNEADFIGATLDTVVRSVGEIGCTYEIIVVDDASQDDSVLKVQQYISGHSDIPIRLQVNSINRGLGNIFVDAAFLGRGKYYRLCVGKNAEDGEALTNILKHIGKADVIIPYNDRPVIGKSGRRLALSGAYTALVNFLSGYKIRYYNGLSIHLRQNVLRYHSSSFGFGFQADLITRLLDEGASYMQVPTYSVDRREGFSSALRMRNVLSVVHTLLEITLRRIRNALYGRNTPPPVEVFFEKRAPQ
jgi:glycosyltransferase involved in cell wall biosynthesis